VEGFFVTGTDTNVGKTVVSAWLVGQLDGCYWKPVQAGTHPETDSDIVRRLAGVPAERILPEAYVLSEPIAPHEAARREGITIDLAKLVLPVCDRPLVVEGAGGLMVPLTDDAYVIDLATELHLPVVLVARSILGTINHTLLSIEAVRARNIALHGIAFIGDANPESEGIITEIGKVKRLGRLPVIEPLTAARFKAVFAENFAAKDFL